TGAGHGQQRRGAELRGAGGVGVVPGRSGQRRRDDRVERRGAHEVQGARGAEQGGEEGGGAASPGHAAPPAESRQNSLPEGSRNTRHGSSPRSGWISWPLGQAQSSASRAGFAESTGSAVSVVVPSAASQKRPRRRGSRASMPSFSRNMPA